MNYFKAVSFAVLSGKLSVKPNKFEHFFTCQRLMNDFRGAQHACNDSFTDGININFVFYHFTLICCSKIIPSGHDDNPTVVY